MGWDAHYVGRNFSQKDRKNVCDGLFCKVVKSAMIGTTYYAAIKIDHPDTGEDFVIGVVVLTSLKNGWLYCKSMSEDMGPYECDCPASILKLLSATDSKYALDWRKRCLDKASNTSALSTLPIGAVIEVSLQGRSYRLEKMAPNFQFKTPWYKVVDENKYVRKSQIKTGWKRVA